jgi:hypothetical protein
MEQFHGQYIVIRIQAVTLEGSELEHIHSIVVKVGGGCAQFDVDRMLNNLSSTGQGELAELLRSKYSPWTAPDVDSKNRWLNQILQALTRYLARPARSAFAAVRPGITPVDASHVTASRSGAQASNSRSTARPTGRATPRVRSCIQDEQPESLRKCQRSLAGAGSSGSGLTHVDNRDRGEVEDVMDYEKFTTT